MVSILRNSYFALYFNTPSQAQAGKNNDAKVGNQLFEGRSATDSAGSDVDPPPTRRKSDLPPATNQNFPEYIVFIPNFAQYSPKTQEVFIGSFEISTHPHEGRPPPPTCVRGVSGSPAFPRSVKQFQSEHFVLSIRQHRFNTAKEFGGQRRATV